VTPRLLGQDGVAGSAAAASSAGLGWPAGAWTWFATPSRRLLLLSILVQLALGVLLGHSVDTRVFMATGYLVSTGHGAYSPADLGAVFHRLAFDTRTVVGYPPPWPLLTGLLYRVSYALVPNLLLYNLALKLPVIAATIGLAYVAGATLQNLGGSPATCRRAWVFVLFNPFILFAGAAWGQIDVIVALVALAALVLVYGGRWGWSAALLALAVCVKPTAAPIALVVPLWLARRSLGEALRYGAVVAGTALLLAVGPFLAFGWSAASIFDRPNGQFLNWGGMSLMTVARLVTGPLVPHGHWWILSLLWIPALAAGAVLVARRVDGTFVSLVRASAALVLVFFLTRAWLSEPNVVLVVALVLIPAMLGELDRRALTGMWVIPLLFAVFNAAPLEVLWVGFPGAMQRSLDAVASYHPLTLGARAALVVAWQVAGWWVVATCLRRPAPEGAAARHGGADLSWRPAP
jgi:hypothetical protein